MRARAKLIDLNMRRVDDNLVFHAVWTVTCRAPASGQAETLFVSFPDRELAIPLPIGLDYLLWVDESLPLQVPKEEA